MSWTAWTADACQTHLRDQEGAYFPQQQSKLVAVPSEWEQTYEVQRPVTGPSGLKRKHQLAEKQPAGYTKERRNNTLGRTERSVTETGVGSTRRKW